MKTAQRRSGIPASGCDQGGGWGMTDNGRTNVGVMQGSMRNYIRLSTRVILSWTVVSCQRFSNGSLKCHMCVCVWSLPTDMTGHIPTEQWSLADLASRWASACCQFLRLSHFLYLFCVFGKTMWLTGFVSFVISKLIAITQKFGDGVKLIYLFI